MKKLFCILPICVSALVACGGGSSDPDSDPGPEVSSLDQGLEAYFSFDGNANDMSGNGRDGAVSGAILAVDRNGTENSAYNFNGIDNSISVPLNINPSVYPQLTLTAWVKVDSEDPIRQVISHDDGGFDRSLGIDFRGGGNGWSTFRGETQSVLGFFPVKVNEWIFIAAVYDQSEGQVKLYVNDQFIQGDGRHGEGWDSLLIGSNPNFGEYFSGSIDEIRIYSRALSNEEIKQLYDSTKGSSTALLADLNGSWEEFLLNDYFGDAVIKQSGDTLEIWNFVNNYTDGVIDEDGYITTDQWGLTASVSQDQNTIVWSNGVIWVRK